MEYLYVLIPKLKPLDKLLQENHNQITVNLHAGTNNIVTLIFIIKDP